MSITKEEKRAIIEKYSKHSKDTGSPEVQIALLSKRISLLTEHFKQFKKDHNSKRGLLRLIGKRKRLLNYLHRKDPERYHNIIKELGL